MRRQPMLLERSPEATPVRSQGAGQFQPPAQQFFDLGRSGLGILPADSQSRHVESQFMKA